MSQVELCEPQVEAEETPTPPATRMKQPTVYYDVARKDYWILNARGEWITVNESGLRRQLRACGYAAKAREGEPLSDVEQCLNKIQLNFDVAYAGPLAGYEKGPIEICGQRILVTRSPNLIEPVRGEFPVLQQLLHSLFGEEQLPYVKGWLKVAYESLRGGHLRSGQVLVLAGERNSGKSLLQNIITEILGGRAAKPYRYMTGGTDFNGELFGAEHLMIEDEVASTDIRSRRHFGSRIKDFTVNVVQSCHAKNRQAISLKPFWRVSLSLNDEPENLMILPPLDDSLGDKMLLLKVSKADLPMPTFTMEERERFWEALCAELPRFLWHLTHWDIPEELKCPRFGITHFHHPQLLAALEDLAPENKLLSLIDSVLWESHAVSFAANPGRPSTPQFWEGTAEELEHRLKNSHYDYEAKRLLEWNNATGAYLGRLAKKHPERVVRSRTNSERLWRITPPSTKV